MRTLGAAVVVVALFWLQPTAGALGSDGLTPEQRGKDPRLTKPVTLAEPRVFVGELLEQLGAQTGVSLTTGEQDGSADVQVCLYVDGARLCDVMDGLWSLLSYRGGAYAWRREGRPGAYVYRFERPLVARNLASRLEGLSQAMYEDDVKTLMEAAAAAPDERRRIVEAAAKQRGDDDPSAACPVLDRTWNGLLAIKESLSPQQLAAVLRGRDPASAIRVPVGELGPRGRELVQSEYESQQSVSDVPGNPPRREPAWLRFGSMRSGSEAPWLCLYVDGLCGFGYAGGAPTTRTLSKRIIDMWLLPGDATVGPADARRLDGLAGEGAPAHVAGWPEPLPRRLHELHAGADLAVLARVPDSQSDPGSPRGGTVEAYRSKVSAGRRMATKWRGEVLLLDYPFWFYDEPAEGTWLAVRELSRSAAGNQGFLSVADLAGAAHTFSASQLRALIWRLPALALAADLHGVLVAACPSRLAANQLLSDQGRPLTPELLAAVRAHAILGNALGWGPVRALRVVEKDVAARQPDSPRGRDLTVGFVSAKGEFIPVMGLRQDASTR